MDLGLKIKELRKLRNITQQELANMLGVSYQAISRWENNITSPDITTLPILANIFNVSVDYILDVNINLNEDKINNYINEANLYLKAGEHKKRSILLKQALMEFPNSYFIMCQLADSLLNELVREDNKKDYTEVIKLCNKIIDKCNDIEIVSEAINTLATTYSYIGKYDEIKKLVDKMPSIEHTKEMFMLHHYSLNDDEGLMKRKELISEFFTNILLTMNLICYSCDDTPKFKFKHTLDERIKISEMQIALIELIYDQKDYGYDSISAIQSSKHLVKLYLEKGNIDKAIEYLNKCYNYSYYADTYNLNSNMKHTSLLFRDLRIIEYCNEYATYLEVLLSFIDNNDEMIKIKDDNRVKEIREKITKILNK